jgi:hypothetical protein
VVSATGSGVAARARPGSTARPHRGQSPAVVTDDGDRNRSQVVHHGTNPFQQGAAARRRSCRPNLVRPWPSRGSRTTAHWTDTVSTGKVAIQEHLHPRQALTPLPSCPRGARR